MTQQTINIGTVGNDGTGDPLRTAFDKCNDNFTELYGLAQSASASAPATASSTGTAGDIAYDSGFLYVCTATNTWKRVAIATW